MEFLLYALVFLFGFFTYKTFFIHRIAFSSLFMLRSAQTTSLIILTKTLENYQYAKTFCAERLAKSGASESDIENFMIYLDNDLEQLKITAIRNMNSSMPGHFKASIVFDDWESAMAFLEVSKTNKHFNK